MSDRIRRGRIQSQHLRDLGVALGVLGLVGVIAVGRMVTDTIRDVANKNGDGRVGVETPESDGGSDDRGQLARHGSRGESVSETAVTSATQPVVQANPAVVVAQSSQTPDEPMVSLSVVKELFELFNREDKKDEEIERLHREVVKLQGAVAALGQELHEERKRQADAAWDKVERIEAQNRLGLQQDPERFEIEDNGRVRPAPQPPPSSETATEPAQDDPPSRPRQPAEEEPSIDSTRVEPPAETTAPPTRRVRRRLGYLNVTPNREVVGYGPAPGTARERIAERERRRQFYVEWSRRYRSRDAGLRILNEMEAGHR